MSGSAAVALWTAIGDAVAADSYLTVSQWADAHRILTTESASEPGRWQTSRTPYLREIMDVLSARDDTQRVVFMKGSQIGATEAGNNWLGYVIHQAPGPMMMVLPTLDVAKKVSKQRVGPMIEAAAELRSRVKEARMKDSENTILVKRFAGGVLVITGANSGAGLRSMPARNLFLDEVDEYPGDVGADSGRFGQGDPVSLAEKRTDTFSRRKIFIPSTPTTKGMSRIEKEFEGSDQRRYFVPCPRCGEFDWIRWENIRWAPGDPATAALRCIACEALIPERAKTAMLAAGQWRAMAPGSRTAGFHLSALYSPLGWKSWERCVAEFLEAKDNPFKLKTWINTVLGETFEERGESVNATSLLSRRRPFAAEVPHGVGILVASVDVQGDRLEVLVKGFGAGEQSWQIHWQQIHGDPALAGVWTELDEVLSRAYHHESGRLVGIECAVVDTGGLHTDAVYRYCRSRLGGLWGRASGWPSGRSSYQRRVFAIRGSSVGGRPLVERPNLRNKFRIPLFSLCVDTGKDIVLSRLLVNAPGPGFVNLPDAPWVDEEYLDQLTAERAEKHWVKGRGWVRSWFKLRPRNEAFDLEVYALAALYILGPVLLRALPERAARFSAPLEAGAPAPPPGEAAPLEPVPSLGRPARGRRRQSGWVQGWRK